DSWRNGFMLRRGPGRATVASLRGLGILASDALELLYPTQCLGCDQRGSWFCQRCAERTQITRGLDHCLTCNRLVGHPGQRCPNDRTATGLPGLQSYGNYREPSLRRAIHYLKYQGVWAAAPHLGAVA